MLKPTILIALLASGPAFAGTTFLALGDSITRGETDLYYAPSLGDMGYVADVANALAAGNGGVRPNVVNLAIDGETASSFNTGRRLSRSPVAGTQGLTRTLPLP